MDDQLIFKCLTSYILCSFCVIGYLIHWLIECGTRIKKTKREAEPMGLNLTEVYKKAHDKTGGIKVVDIAQHNESCARLMDALAKEKPSDVLAELEARK